MAVGEQHHLLLPADTVGWFQINRLRIGEVTVSFSGFVLDISRQYLLIRETGGNAGGIGEVASAVIAYVENQSVARGQVGEYFVKVTVTYTAGE